MALLLAPLFLLLWLPLMLLKFGLRLVLALVMLPLMVVAGVAGVLLAGVAAVAVMVPLVPVVLLLFLAWLVLRRPMPVRVV